jgi:hypothetical protein
MTSRRTTKASTTSSSRMPTRAHTTRATIRATMARRNTTSSRRSSPRSCSKASVLQPSQRWCRACASRTRTTGAYSGAESACAVGAHIVACSTACMHAAGTWMHGGCSASVEPAIHSLYPTSADPGACGRLFASLPAGLVPGLPLPSAISPPPARGLASHLLTYLSLFAAEIFAAEFLPYPSAAPS